MLAVSDTAEGLFRGGGRGGICIYKSSSILTSSLVGPSLGAWSLATSSFISPSPRIHTFLSLLSLLPGDAPIVEGEGWKWTGLRGEDSPSTYMFLVADGSFATIPSTSLVKNT